METFPAPSNLTVTADSLAKGGIEFEFSAQNIYKHEKWLGKGGMGQVYLVSKANKQYVLKLTDTISEYEISSEIIKSKPNCPNVVQLFDTISFKYKDSEGLVCEGSSIVMEYIAGGDGSHFLKDLINKKLTLDQDSAITIFKGIINGMICFHKTMGRYSFDFKAPNVMIDYETLVPKLIDIDGSVTLAKIKEDLKQYKIDQDILHYPTTLAYAAISKNNFADFKNPGKSKYLNYGVDLPPNTPDDQALNKFLLIWDDFQVGKTICMFVRNLANVIPAAPKNLAIIKLSCLAQILMTYQ